MVSLGVVFFFGLVAAFFIYAVKGEDCADAALRAVHTADEDEAAGVKQFGDVLQKAQGEKETPKNRGMAYVIISRWYSDHNCFERNLAILDDGIAACKAADMKIDICNLLLEKADALHKVGRGSESLIPAKEAIDTFKNATNVVDEPGWQVVLNSSLSQALIDSGDAPGARASLSIAASQLPKSSSDKTLSSCRIKTLQAQIALLEKKLDQSESQFAGAMADLDKAFPPGGLYQERALFEYAKALRNFGFDDRADYYNAKLDNPQNFYCADWRSRYSR